MSARWRNLKRICEETVHAHDLSPSEAHVLLLLGIYADDNLQTFVGNERVARAIGVTPSTVSRTIAKLERRQLVHTRRRQGTTAIRTLRLDSDLRQGAHPDARAPSHPDGRAASDPGDPDVRLVHVGCAPSAHPDVLPAPPEVPPEEPQEEPALHVCPNEERALTQAEHDDLETVSYDIAGTLRRAVDGLTTDEDRRLPTRQGVLSILVEQRPSVAVALEVATSTKAHVQAQDRAPNIEGLYATRLANALAGSNPYVVAA